MKKKTLLTMALTIIFAGAANAQSDREAFIEACLQQAGLTSFEAVCEAKSAKDALALEQIGLDSRFQVNFKNATTGVSWYNGQEFYNDVTVPVKGLFFKKYLSLKCDVRPNGEIQVGGFKVDIENRIDTKITANVDCR